MLFGRRRPEPEITVQIPPDSADDALDSATESALFVKTDTVEFACSKHIGTREYQQDSVEVGTGADGVVFGVLCDGMGGLEDGELASRTAAQALAEALREMDPSCDIPAFLSSHAHSINKLIFELPSDVSKRGAAGTTLCAAVIVGDSLFWLSVGDSRIYIIRKQEILAVTREHSYSLDLEEQVRAGRITAEEAAEDPSREALISYIGMDELALIDCNRNPFLLESGDIVLLCSDGLYRSLGDADILEVLARHSGNISECARVLPLYAFDKAQGAQDNTSVIILWYRNENNDSSFDIKTTK